MLVFWKERLVYLATPKTGSTAIEAALESVASVVIQRPPELKHTAVRHYWEFIAPYLQRAADEDFMVVAMMREPVSWLGSWYRYRQRDGVPRPERRTNGLSFTEFVEGYLDDPQPAYAQVGSQAQFLAPQRGPGIDRLFRYEHIAGFVAFLEERLDFEITLPRLNVSPEAPLDLAPETEAKLRAARARDFALYDTLP
ncbi:MAG: hypothetical protein H6895_07815 [Defluviimonas sp.]|uniref:hypothetical protein n=1 Tax=Albidovulum sp. TaxID=1872424 RepID=UPI001D78478E|nr:hypothetical protein [Paracoccaceae bacterium]MCC0063979.1 hypothetical protein [Defluviimonas sp.]